MSGPLNPALIWNGWSSNYISREDGYRIHAWLEGSTRALCGAPIADSGLLNFKDGEFEPGYIRLSEYLTQGWATTGESQ